MPLQFKIQKFEGPLDLLLQLVLEEELPISEVSLAKVTEQYLEHITHAIVPPDELADFLLVASRLLLIKSKTLLPDLEIDDEGPSLADQLRMYKEYVEASKEIFAMIKKKRFAFPRVQPPRQEGFFPPKTITAAKLEHVFAEILQALAPIIQIPRAALSRAMSIKEKIKLIQDVLARELNTKFSKLITSSKNRTEVIVSFLALLELVKQRLVDVEQGELFTEIAISRSSVMPAREPASSQESSGSPLRTRG